MNAAKLVFLTRFSLGSLRLRNPAARRRLAQEIRAQRQRQQALWELHTHPRTYRIFQPYDTNRQVDQNVRHSDTGSRSGPAAGCFAADDRLMPE